MRVVLFSSLAILFSASSAYASECNRIKSSDLRYFCKAQVDSRPDFCNKIRNRDDKNMCLAIVTNEKSKCNQIKNKDKRHYCQAISG